VKCNVKGTGDGSVELLREKAEMQVTDRSGEVLGRRMSEKGGLRVVSRDALWVQPRAFSGSSNTVCGNKNFIQL
jgi:hypothetical protein